MVPKLYSASAPGTLMLLGEHAVLHNKPAIVFAIDKRITVKLTAREDQKISINSSLGRIEFNLNELDNLTNQKSFQFVLTAIKQFEEELKVKNQGFELLIDSEFSHECGFGSSAAVTVATVAVLFAKINKSTEINKAILFETARKIIREVQGAGSGADVAASVYGGVIVYQQESPYILKKLDLLLPLVVIYSGFKTPTPEVIKKVEALRLKYPNIVHSLFDAMEYGVNRAAVCIENQDWSQLGEILNIQQGIMNALGVSTPVLNQLIDGLNSEPGIYGSKISGSGLGDCIIGIGLDSHSDFALNKQQKKIPVAVSLEGVRYE